MRLLFLQELGQKWVEPEQHGVGRIKRSRSNEGQVIGILTEREVGFLASDVCRRLWVGSATFCK